MTEKRRLFLPREIKESTIKKARELAPYKENWRVNFGILTISGDSGTGKTTLADYLALIYKITEERNIKVGQIVRDIMQRPRQESFIQRESSVDSSVDDEQENIMKKANSELPFILESRLGGFLSYEVKANSSRKLPIVSILLTASMDKIVERVRFRRPELSRDQIIQKEKERAEGDLRLWKSIHPNLDNPYDHKYFDLVIDTDPMKPEDVFRYLHNWLLRNNWVSKKEEKTKDLPNKGQIFPNSKA